MYERPWNAEQDTPSCQYAIAVSVRHLMKSLTVLITALVRPTVSATAVSVDTNKYISGVLSAAGASSADKAEEEIVDT